jgi:hypothetical protein
VSSAATKALILLFVALVIQCAFDGSGAKAASPSLPKEDSAFCGVLSAASVDITLPAQLIPQPSSGEVVGTPPEIHPAWSLVQSIDHPPERRV